jgi:hypothetical protein
LSEGLALGDILVKKVNEQGFIDAPNIQTCHVQLADGRRGTLTYKVTRNGLEVPNFEFGRTKFDAKDISVLTPHWEENPLYQDNVFSDFD